jgi:putative methyltransferase (TIGR04325 family)
VKLISRVYDALAKRLGLEKYGWFGDYATWEEASKRSTGYDSALIAEKVKEALMKVKHGEAAFERDSVVFEKYEYSWPLLAGLNWIAAQGKGKLRVMDFGGSMGSLYFQYRKFFSVLDVQWNIVEQKNFVEYGKKYFQDDRLRFHFTMQDCMNEWPVDVTILSSVLPYIQEPYKVLAEVIRLKPPFIIFDKMPFLKEGDKDRITVQRVHPSIYPATYPAWFFNERRFLDFLSPHYSLIEEFEGSDSANIPSVFKGFIFQRKNN